LTAYIEDMTIAVHFNYMQKSFKFCYMATIQIYGDLDICVYKPVSSNIHKKPSILIHSNSKGHLVYCKQS